MRLERRRDPPGVKRILQALPDWFGIPEAIEGYVRDAGDPDLGSVLVVDGDLPVGVALTARHFPESAELHLLAVAPERHRTGLGRALVERVAADLAVEGCRWLSVHTVGPSVEDAAYARTRAFYRALDFDPLEEHVGLDWPGPTLILVRALAIGAPSHGG